MAVESLHTQPFPVSGRDRGPSVQCGLARKQQLEDKCFNLDDGRLQQNEPHRDVQPETDDRTTASPSPVWEDVSKTVTVANRSIGAADLLPSESAPAAIERTPQATLHNRTPAVNIAVEGKQARAAAATRPSREQAVPVIAGEMSPSPSFKPANVLVTATATERCLYIRDYFSSTEDLLDWIDTELARQQEQDPLPIRVFVNGKEYAQHAGKLLREETNHGN